MTACRCLLHDRQSNRCYCWRSQQTLHTGYQWHFNTHRVLWCILPQLVFHIFHWHLICCGWASDVCNVCQFSVVAEWKFTNSKSCIVVSLCYHVLSFIKTSLMTRCDVRDMYCVIINILCSNHCRPSASFALNVRGKQLFMTVSVCVCDVCVCIGLVQLSTSGINIKHFITVYNRSSHSHC